MDNGFFDEPILFMIVVQLWLMLGSTDIFSDLVEITEDVFPTWLRFFLNDGWHFRLLCFELAESHFVNN